MSDGDVIRSIRSQTLAVIDEITKDPKPTYRIDGQRVEWSEYLETLRQTVEWCNQQLTGEDPFEIESQGHT